jgi:L-alanine-DL-glutamate epimerase-like enolase superfamily enzyme
MKLHVKALHLPFAAPIRISRRVYESVDAVLVTVACNGKAGRGEATGAEYRGDTMDVMLAQLATASSAATAGELDRDSLQQLLPAGGARNAVDCALWDLEAKTSGVTAAMRAGFAALTPLQTVITLGIDTPARMGAKAQALGVGALLKIKLGEAGDLDRLRAIRAAAPTASLIVDANQGWCFDDLRELLPEMQRLGVQLIEQPLPVRQDDGLRTLKRTVPICADESCQDRSSLPSLLGKYDAINIKLDKTGGLTEALALAGAARALGLRLMVGCMGGTSLCIAPAFLVGQRCDVVDLDCPLLLARDVKWAMRFDGNTLYPCRPELWG